MGIGDAPVRFAGQTNIVVWDRQRSMEYFVRNARFDTKGKSLGFIAPSPTLPRIVAAGTEAFAVMSSLDPTQGYSGGFGGGGGMGGGGGVQVVARKVVSGYEATTLRADDPQALVGWLQGNGYAVPRFASRWAAPYVRKKWYFAAFKVAAGEGAGDTGPVCMSFLTKTPFNPYSVPAENTGRGGLSLYYVSNGDEVPKIGGTQPWLSPRWTKPLSEENTKRLEAGLGATTGTLPKGSNVRFYRDEGFGRPGLDDLYFVVSPKAVSAPGDKGATSGNLASRLVAGLGLCAFAFVRIGRRR